MNRVVGIYYPSHLPLAQAIKTYVLDCGDDAKFRHPEGFRATEIEGFGKVIVVEGFYEKEIASEYERRGVEVELYEQNAKIEGQAKEAEGEVVAEAKRKRGRRASAGDRED